MNTTELNKFVKKEADFVKFIAEGGIAFTDTEGMSDYVYDHISQAYAQVRGRQSANIYFMTCTDPMFLHWVNLAISKKMNVGVMYNAAWKRFYVEQAQKAI